MNGKSNRSDDDPLDREVEFRKGGPNPYWLGVVDRKCVRVLAKDLAEIFPDNESVDVALRSIAETRKKSRSKVSARNASLTKKTKR